MNPRSFLGKCKSCKKPFQALGVPFEEKKVMIDRDRQGNPKMRTMISWQITGGIHDNVRTPLSAPWNGKWQISLSCPRCNKPMMLQAVSGTFSEKPCGAKCMASTGPSCECTCRGVNHGKSHG